MRERTIEALLRSRVRETGGLSIKLAPTEAGVPDQLVLLPGGRIFLVELKTTHGRLRPIQRLWHEKAMRAGTRVVVLAGVEQVEEWILWQTK